VDDGLKFAAVVLLVEAAVLLVEAVVSLAEAVVWAAPSEAAGAGGETLLCGWLTGGLAVSVAPAVASSKAANCEPSESWAAGVESGHWDEVTVKLARTSDAELGTINPCGRRRQPIACNRRASATRKLNRVNSMH